MNLETLKNVPRLLIEAKLVPVQGDRFQPTGFADLGAATYQRPDGTQMLLVETAQSMANRLEAVCVAEDRVRANDDLEGLPYVLVKFTGEGKGETSSLYEAHRLNSPFILKSTGFEEKFAQDIGFETGRMIDWKKIAATFFRLDPSSLVHGTFMANFEDGRVRLPRALTSFIEAENVNEVASGGVKNNPLDPSGTLRAVGYDENVYSNVPYHRTEYVAGAITAFFNLDLAQLRGYGLPADATRLLLALSLYKIRRLLDGGLRLRTACDLRVLEERVTTPQAAQLPSADDVLKDVQAAISACAKAGLFAKPAVTELSVATRVKKEKDADKGATQAES